MKTLLYKIRICFLFFLIFLNYNCFDRNENNNPIETKKADTSTLSADTLKNTLLHEKKNEINSSANIKGFMSFNSNTTYSTIQSYFSSRSINYVLNPDFSLYFKPGRHPDGIAFTMDCPFAKFILAPALTLENFHFKNVVFTFSSNKLLNLTMTESLMSYQGGELIALKDFYSRKYSTGKHHIDTAKTSGFIDETFMYENIEDSVRVFFNMIAEMQPGREINKYLYSNYFTIDFNPSLREKLSKECSDDFWKKENMKKKSKEEQEKKILDNL